MEHYKYIHVLWHNEKKFNLPFVEFINNNIEIFNPNEHFFVTPYKDVYNSIKEICRSELTENVNIINKYGEYCDLMIIHSLECLFSKFIFTKKKYAKKVVWRTWGHDVIESQKWDKPESESLLKYMKKYFKINCKAFLHKRICKQFRAIAIANIVDKLKIKKVYGNIEMFCGPYCISGNREEIIRSVEKNRKPHSHIRVMIGHSGQIYERHIEIIENMKKYLNEDIIISIPLSYGNADYIEQVKTFAKENIPPEKLEILTDFMTYDKYTEYIASVDIASLAIKKSNALGNLLLLAYFGSKLYIDAEGDLACAFNHLGCRINDIDEIGKVSFDEFIEYTENDKKMLRKNFGVLTDNNTKFKEYADNLERIRRVALGNK